MQRHTIFLLFAAACVSFSFLPVVSQEKQPKEANKAAPKAEAKRPDAKQAEKTDVTREVQAMNSIDQFEAPPTQFRKGKVSPRKLDAKAIQKKDNGFTIQLPSKAPVPTPTVYKGKIYVSGGFQSNEFYCFDAVSGKLVWAVTLDDDGPTSAVCEDDICVLNTESCTIFALNASTGEQLWSWWLGDPLTSTPTIANGKVFTSYPVGALNLPEGGLNNPQQMAPMANGKKKSVKPPPAPPEELAKKTEGKDGKDADKAKDDKAEKKAADAKFKAGDSIKQPQGPQRPSATHVLACLDLKTGEILWQRWIDSDVMSAPVAVLGDVYATSFGGTVYRFSQEKGTILSAQHSRATSAPVVVGTNVYLTNRADNGKGAKVQEQISNVNRALSSATYTTPPKDAAYLDERVQTNSELDKAGKALDKLNGFAGGAPQAANPMAAQKNVGQGNVSTMQAFQGSRILHFQNGNYNCMGNVVSCTDPATGNVKWNLELKGDLEKLGGFLASPPAAAGGSLFLATVQGEILRVDPDKGKILEKYKVGSPMRFQPAIEGGRIYVGTQDGKVVCIDTGNPQFTGWSTWGANAAHTNVVEKNATAK